MEATELRIGNFIKDRGGKIWQIDSFEYNTKVCSKEPILGFWEFSKKPILGHPLTEEISFLQPIPLTEEILLKCGFIKCEDFDEGGLIDYRYELHLFNGSISFTSNWSTEDSIYVNLNQCGTDVFYLHQLQNLYFAIMGKELTVNL